MLLARGRESTSFHLCWSKEKKISPVLMPALIFSKQFYRFEIETRGEQTRLKSAWPHITEGGIKLCPTSCYKSYKTSDCIKYVQVSLAGEPPQGFDTCSRVQIMEAYWWTPTSVGRYAEGSAATLAQRCTHTWWCRVIWTWAWPFIITPGSSTGTLRSVWHRLKLVNTARKRGSLETKHKGRDTEK